MQDWENVKTPIDTAHDAIEGLFGDARRAGSEAATNLLVEAREKLALALQDLQTARDMVKRARQTNE